MKWFKKKRNQVAKTLPKESSLIVPSFPEHFRQVDVKQPYRQDSNFYYLTGFEQANSLFFLFPSGRSVLFSEDKNPVKEIWDGPVHSQKEIKIKFLIDEVYPLSDLDKKLPSLLRKESVLFYDYSNPLFDQKIKLLKIKCRSVVEFLKPFRRIKDKTEISSIQKAIAISIHAHKQIAKALKPGINERALHGIFLKSIMEKGSVREAYGSIVAGGANAVTLHYIKNSSTCKKGTLLLLDAGAEKDYYASDITRVYPVSGRFSSSQKALYNDLLRLQKELIREVCPGASLKAINKKMFEEITKICVRQGLLKGSVQGNLEKKSYREYCPHSVGHLLGLDVHDVSFDKTERGILQPGMVLTIEPGIYISSKDQKAPKDLRGMGLRIEDNILVTDTGCKNLTKAMPKEVSEIEQLCQSQ